MIRTEGATFAELDGWIERLDRAMDAARGRVMRRVAEELGRVLVSAAPPGMPAEPVSENPGEPFVSMDTLGLIVTLWAPEAAGNLLSIVTEVFAHGAGSLASNALGARARRELAEPVAEVLDSSLAQEYLASAHNRMARFSDEMWEIARAQLLEGFVLGESIDSLRDRLVDVAGLTEPRARTVARTEVVSASNAGSLALVEIAGFTGTKTWLATPDTRTRPTHVAADGQAVGLDSPFEVGGDALSFPGDPTGQPEEIINCVVGSTHVAWPGQAVYASTRRSYRGALVKLTTANGHALSVTPNHPILTNFGYRPAQSLRPLDEIYATRDAGSPDISHIPPRADQFHRALSNAGVSARMVGSVVDFHGDGSNAEVEIVSSDRDLCLDRGSELQGDTGEGFLVGLYETESNFSSAGHGGMPRKNHPGDWFRLGPSPGDVSGVGECSPVLWCECCHPQGIRLTGTADREPDGLEPANDQGSADIEFLRHAKHALSLGMALTEIIEIEIDNFAHVDVYNLSTSDGWYIANGIASHNCRCTLTYDLDDEPLTAAGDEMATGAWVGVLTVEGRPTGDRRMFAPGALTWEELPLPLLWQRETDNGHRGSVIVGRIDEVARTDSGLIVGRGTFDLETPEGRDAYGRVRRRYLSGTSVDTDNFVAIDVEYVYGPGMDADGDPAVDMVIFHAARLRGATLCAISAFIEAKISLTASELAVEDEEFPADGPIPRPRPGIPYTDLARGGYVMSNQQLHTLVDWDVLTAAAIGAHDTPTVETPWDSDEQVGRLDSPMTVMTAEHMYAWMDDARVEDGQIVKDALKFPHHEVSADGEPGAANLVACSAGIAALHGARGGTDIPEVDRRGVYNHLRAHLIDGGRAPESIPEFEGDGEALTAAAYVLTIPDVPPREWFEEPTDVPIEGALTVTDSGRVYGYLAPAGVAHRSFERRVTVPMGNVDYSLYMGRETIVADGSRVVTGALTMDCGHASQGIQSGGVALDHYDNSCSIVATVRIGESAGGVWVAGALVPGVTASQIGRMMACQLSGDWRPHRGRGGWREFAGALLVPVPGFAMPRVSPSVRVTEGALVASAVPVRYLTAGGCGCEARPDAVTVEGAVDGDGSTMSVPLDLSGVADVIARSVGLDFASRAEKLRSSMQD